MTIKWYHTLSGDGTIYEISMTGTQTKIRLLDYTEKEIDIDFQNVVALQTFIGWNSSEELKGFCITDEGELLKSTRILLKEYEEPNELEYKLFRFMGFDSPLLEIVAKGCNYNE